MKKQFSLAPIFKDSMVFQANKPIRIFGACKKNIDLEIDFLHQHQQIRTKGTSFIFELNPEAINEEGFSFTIKSKKQSQTFYNCLIGDVFLLIGGLNAALPLNKSYHEDDINKPHIRLLTASMSLDENQSFDGEMTWQICGRQDLGQTSALSHEIARQLSSYITTPIGIISVTKPDATIFSWMSLQDINTHLDIHRFISEHIKTNQKSLHASLMYEEIINKIHPFSLAAIILYQGEHDGRHDHLYQAAMQRIIKTYRKSFDDRYLDFILIQLAGFTYPNFGTLQVTHIRDIQSHLQDQANHINIVTAIDLGEEKQLILREKYKLSKRIAHSIREHIHKADKNSIPPMFYSYQKQGNNLLLFTKNNYLNLVSKSGRCLGFYGSEDGEHFRQLTNIEIMNNRILIKGIEGIVEIRYAYDKYPTCDIFTTNDLPLLPFRIEIHK